MEIRWKGRVERLFCRSLICTPSNKWLPKYMINSMGESQSGFGVSQTWRCQFQDVSGPKKWPFCPYCQTHLWDAELTVRKPASLLAYFPIAGSVDGNWRHCSSMTSSVSNLPAMGALTQEIKPWMPCLSEEVIKSLPGGKFHGFIYHPDLTWVSGEEAFPKPLAVIWTPRSCFDHSLVIISTLWTAGFDSIMLIHFSLRRYITVARSFR